MFDRFAGLGPAVLPAGLLPDRVPGALKMMAAFAATPVAKADPVADPTQPVRLPDFYPQVRSQRTRETQAGMAAQIAARLAAGLQGTSAVWPQVEAGLHYLLSFSPPDERPASLPAGLLLWTAGVLFPSHPWARWWILAGSLRTAELVASTPPDRLEEYRPLLTATLQFVSQYTGRAETVPTGVVTAIGLQTGLPSIADLATDALHLDEAAFAQEIQIDQSPAEKGDALALRRKIITEFTAPFARLREHPLGEELLPRPESHREEIVGILENRMILRNHMLRTHDFGRTVDWLAVLDGDIESNVSINHLFQVLLLAGDWRHTRHEAAGRHAVRLLRSWFEQAPTPPLRSDGPWRTLETAGRLARSWPLIASALIDRADFRELVLPDLARWLFLTVRYHLAFCGPSNNWFQIESAGSLLALHFFPRWAEQARLTALFSERLRWINNLMFLSDGCQAENAPGYHVFPWSYEANAFAVLEALGGQAPARVWDVLDRGAEPLWKLRLPDGTLPPFGDANPRPVRGDDALREYARRRNLPRLLATIDRPTGVASGSPNTRLEQGGYSVARTGWESTAAALVFDHGFFGTNHQHEDKLNFWYFAAAQGCPARSLVGDGGICRYVDDDYERYFRGAWAHNAVTIDGRMQAASLRHIQGPRPGHLYAWQLPDLSGGWLPGEPASGSSHDLAATFIPTLLWGEFNDGFAYRTLPLWAKRAGTDADTKSLITDWVHRRVLAFFGHDGVVIMDHLESRSKDTKPHAIEAMFHLMPFLNADETYCTPGTLRKMDNGFELTHAVETGVRVRHVGGASSKLRLQSYCGSTTPVRGYSAIDGEMPSHDVVFAEETPFPLTWVTVIEPIASAAVGPVPAAALQVGKIDRDRVHIMHHGKPWVVELTPEGARWGSA